MQYQSESYGLLPHVPGVYQFLSKTGEILYVGKAKDLRNRVSSYFTQPETLIGKTKILVGQIRKIKITEVASELEALLLEAALIKKYTPKYNIRLTDGKMYPLIRIVSKSDYPAVLTARQKTDTNSVYFGPYPSALSMHRVLKMLRRIFPFQSVLNHPKKICLYHHLRLCPCPPTFTTLEEKKAYKKTILHIIGFLEGRSKKVIKNLEKERDAYAKNEEFEKASAIQKQLDAIKRVTEPFTNPFEYVTNPNLLSDMRRKEMENLQEVLGSHGIVINLPNRIECYDNSNFQGTNPTSSMVVLTDGEPDTAQYRRFKIRGVTGPNDFASMQEVLTRRVKHTEWAYPDLFIVDGGKGQVSAAKKVFDELGIQIPLIGLAKREEILITSNLQEIRLPKSSHALQLVMRIRDEAHRFAVTFHKKLRSKANFS